MNSNVRLAGISSMATRHLLSELVEAWTQGGGDRIAIESVGGADAARRAQDGEAFDLVVLASDALDKLIAAGHLLADSKADLVRSSVAIAVRSGSAAPRIDSEESLRRAVLSARSVGYSTGPSGLALSKLFTRWGIVDEMRHRLVQAPAGVAVGTLIAHGDVSLGFQQLSELMNIDGVAVVGEMPEGLEIVTTFSGALGARAAQPGLAREFLAFICSPLADEAKRRNGMQPV